MTDRELMQQALDWMDRNGEVVFANSGLSAVLSMNLVAEALRARLAQPEPEPVAWWNGASKFASPSEKNWDKRTGGILSAGCDIPLYTAPPQREPESILNSLHCNCGASWTFKDGALEYKPSKREKNT